MSYTISHKGTEGQTLTATVQRITDGYYWDNVANSWIDSNTSDCLVSLPEGATPGNYSVSLAALTPASGNVFRIVVYSSGVPQFYTDCLPYNPNQKTALELVNEVQRRMRLPLSASIVDTHAQLILSFLNDTAINIVSQISVWDALKFRGGLYTTVGVNIYPVLLANISSGVDTLRNLQIDGEPVSKNSDREFRDFKRNYDSPAGGTPSVYRNYGRSGGDMLIEICVTPDDEYLIEFEGLIKVSPLVAASDLSPLDQDALILGALALARDEGGEDAQGATTLFKMKMDLMDGSEGESGWGDVEAT